MTPPNHIEDRFNESVGRFQRRTEEIKQLAHSEPHKLYTQSEVIDLLETEREKAAYDKLLFCIDQCDQFDSIERLKNFLNAHKRINYASEAHKEEE